MFSIYNKITNFLTTLTPSLPKLTLINFHRDNRPVTGASTASSQFSEKDEENKTSLDAIPHDPSEQKLNDSQTPDDSKETKTLKTTNDKAPRHSSLLLVGPKGAVRRFDINSHSYFTE